MSTIVKVNNNLLTKKKHHVFLIYAGDKDGSCAGGYHDLLLKIGGGCEGNSFEEMCDEAYESLQEAVDGEKNIPFDIEHIKESVVFDCLECQTIDQMDMVFDLIHKGKNFDELKKIINE